VRSLQMADADMKRIQRSGERVIASCSCKPAEEDFTLALGGGSDVSYLYVTTARMIWMSANNEGVVSVPWKYMTGIRQGKKRFKHTLGYSFRRPGYSSDIDYPAEYVSGDVAKAVSGIQSGAIPTIEIPAQTATAIKYSRPHDNSPIGMLARMQGIPEYRLACSVCGKSAGFCQATGDELSDACGGCERSFTGITTA
jgi:hypothetical protein